MQLIRRIANRAKDALFIAPLELAWSGDMRGKVTCLLYHRVGEPAGDFLDRGGSPVITPRELERDLALLRNLGAVFLTFEDLRNGRFPDAHQIGAIISFDDCFASNYTIGLDVIERAGVKATFFQTTALVDADRLLWEHELYWHTRDDQHAARFAALAREILGEDRDDWVEHLREDVAPDVLEPLLTAAREDVGAMSAAARALYPASEQIRAARTRGHEIGSHGHRHFKRVNIDAGTFESELRTSSERLHAILGEKAGAFSYPFNSYVAGDAAICARHFAQAVTVDKKRIERDTDPFSLPRFTWPGPGKNALRHRRWILTGRI